MTGAMQNMNRRQSDDLLDKGLHFNCCILRLRRVFRRLGTEIGARPWLFLLTSIGFVCACLTGFAWLRMGDDVRMGYTPLDAPSRQEYAAYRAYRGLQAGPFGLVLVMEARNGTSVIDSDNFDEVFRVLEYLMHDVPVLEARDGEQAISYSGVCPDCTKGVLPVFKSLLDNQRSLIAAGSKPSPMIRLNFPISEAFGQKLLLSGHLFGVRSCNGSCGNAATSIEHASLLAFYLLADRTGAPAIRSALVDWQLRVFELSLNGSFSRRIRFYVYGDEVINKEVLRGGLSTMPYLTVGFLLMFALVGVSVSLSSHCVGALGWRTLAVVGGAIASPMLATCATFGLVLWCGTRINSIMCITPFLVLGIGVDDAFLMLHAWQRLTKSRERPPVAARLGATFDEVAPGIAITSLTNALAFGLGAFSPLPQIRGFCAATAVAIALDFVFQCTLFAPLLALIGRRESYEAPSESSFRIHDRTKFLEQLNEIYSRFLASAVGRLMAVLFLVVAIAFAVVGTLRMRSSFLVERTFPADSHFLDTTAKMDVIRDEHYTVQVIVRQPPNISDTAQLDRFKQSVAAFEALNGSLGANYTLLWMRDYENYLTSADSWLIDFFDSSDQAEPLSYDSIPEFVDQPFYQHWNASIQWRLGKTGAVEVAAFDFLLAYGGMRGWKRRTDQMVLWRSLTRQYPEFDMVVFDYESPMYDLVLAMSSVALRAVITTVVFMAIVCLFFIPMVLNVLIASAAIALLTLCELGSLSWWQTDMDPITMVNVMMATGLNVDYVAHVSYHFYASGAAEAAAAADERLRSTMRAVVWPLLQAGLSTAVCIAPLALNNVYTFTVFVKTIVLVVVWGFAFAFFVLPVLLASLPGNWTGETRRPTADRSMSNDVDLPCLDRL